MSARQRALEFAAIAGYHGDTARFTRLVVESRVARKALDQAWNLGKTAKEAGVGCHCAECRNLDTSAQVSRDAPGKF